MRSVDQACPGTGLCSACASAGASASAKCLKVFLPMQFFCHCHRFVGGVSLLPAAVCAARCTLPAFRRSARVALLAAASLLLLLLLRVVCCCLIFYKIGMKSAFPLRYVFTFLLLAFFSLFSLFLAFYLF